MIDKQIKSKTKKNSKTKFEVSKPNFLISTKPDKFMEKNSNKLIYNIDNQNKRKMEQIKVKINLLQEILSKNKISENSKKIKISLSKDKIKKSDKKNNVSIDKDTSNVCTKYNYHFKFIKSPYYKNSNHFYSKKALYDSFNSKSKYSNDQLSDNSHNDIRIKDNKEYFIKKQKPYINSNKKNKIDDFYNQDLTERQKITKIRNIENYSIDRENTSIDKSVNFNQIKNNMNDTNKNKDEKYNIKKNLIQVYSKSGDIKLSEINNNILTNESNFEPELKLDKAITQYIKNLDEEITSIHGSSSNFSSKDYLTHNNNHSSLDQVEGNHMENFCKETPSTKNTIKNETRISENIFNFKHNKIVSADNSIKNSGDKKKLLNKSVNRIRTTNKSKILPTSSNKNILSKENRKKNNHSHENRNKYNIKIIK